MTIYTLTDRNWPDFTRLLTDMVDDDTCLSSENQTFLYFEISLDWKYVNFAETKVTTITHKKACQCWIYLLCFYNFFVLWSKFCVIWIHSGGIFLNQTSLFFTVSKCDGHYGVFPNQSFFDLYSQQACLCCDYWQSTISATKCFCQADLTCSTYIFNFTTILLSNGHQFSPMSLSAVLL